MAHLGHLCQRVCVHWDVGQDLADTLSGPLYQLASVALNGAHSALAQLLAVSHVSNACCVRISDGVMEFYICRHNRLALLS